MIEIGTEIENMKWNVLRISLLGLFAFQFAAKKCLGYKKCSNCTTQLFKYKTKVFGNLSISTGIFVVKEFCY